MPSRNPRGDFISPLNYKQQFQVLVLCSYYGAVGSNYKKEFPPEKIKQILDQLRHCLDPYPSASYKQLLELPDNATYADAVLVWETKYGKAAEPTPTHTASPSIPRFSPKNNLPTTNEHYRKARRNRIFVHLDESTGLRYYHKETKEGELLSSEGGLDYRAGCQWLDEYVERNH